MKFLLVFLLSFSVYAMTKDQKKAALTSTVEEMNHCKIGDECMPTYLQADEDGFCETLCGHPGILIHQSELKKFQTQIKLKKNCPEAKCAQNRALYELVCENWKCVVKSELLRSGDK